MPQPAVHTPTAGVSTQPPTLQPQSSYIGQSNPPNEMGIPMQHTPAMSAAADAQLGMQYQQQLFARCARGDHDIERKYGVCGIITSVICFPIGLLALLVDVEQKCTRCGVIIRQ
ncbi:hypothetical protein BDW22DRAFT_1337059 [Trametopsis cervina]|nr:hypothetical protein BDW22DRAFT_1337059 [Trametopsis cervina]